MFRHVFVRLASPVALLPIALIACAHQPAKPVAQESSGATTAVAEANGVRVLASADSWEGKRSRSAHQFTPIQVTIENHSGRALRVAYQDFSLTDRAGAQYLPLLAMKDKSYQALHGSLMASAPYQPMAVYAPTSEPCGRQDRLVDAPYQAYSYAGPLPAGNVFPYASTSGDSWCPEQLPTPQMVTAALAEKPLPNDARAEGFVYFQAQGDRGAPGQLTMNLVDAVTGQPFGRAELRFAAND